MRKRCKNSCARPRIEQRTEFAPPRNLISKPKVNPLASRIGFWFAVSANEQSFEFAWKMLLKVSYHFQFHIVFKSLNLKSLNLKSFSIFFQGRINCVVI